MIAFEAANCRQYLVEGIPHVCTVHSCYTANVQLYKLYSFLRFSLDHSSVPYTEYLTDALREVGASLNGLSCSPTPLGLAAIADTANMSEYNVIARGC